MSPHNQGSDRPPRRAEDGARDPSAPDAATVERESLLQHGLDASVVVGRAAAGALRGASPVPASRQLLLQAEALLATRLADGEGSLARALLARLADAPQLLARHPHEAPAALADLVDGYLAAPALLAELVRDVDARWGRDYDERPRFEAPGRPPAPDDPYTLAGVEALLRDLRGAL